MNVLFVLTVILAGLMVAIGGETGFFSFLGMFLNVIVFLVMCYLLYRNVNVYGTVFASCLLIACINFFFVNGWNQRTQSAFLATLIVMILVCLLVPIVVNKAYIQGFAPEETEELGHFSMLIDINFRQLSLALILVGMMGAVTDSALAVASAMAEIKTHNAAIAEKELLQSGLRIGKDILGTTINTLLFAFFGSQLALIIWFKDLHYGFAELVNSQILVAEMLTMLLTGSFAILILPFTAWICSKRYSRAPEQVAFNQKNGSAREP